MLSDKIAEDLKNAQLERNELAVSTLRMLLSEIKNAQIQKGADLLDPEVIFVIAKEAKKRKEAAAGFRSGGREEAAQKEEDELKILESYLPAQLSDEELTNVVEEVIKETGATSVSEMGRVMSAVMVKVSGQADGGRVAALVKERLSK